MANSKNYLRLLKLYLRLPRNCSEATPRYAKALCVPKKVKSKLTESKKILAYEQGCLGLKTPNILLNAYAYIDIFHT